MKTVAVIAEYNPFHTGHQYHLRSIRQSFGDDTAIVVIMSGNYTQRGEIACIDKITRARCAILGGADLVLELPFPFSMSSAEFFAKSGVHIAHKIGIVDALSFGSECGDLQELQATAQRLSSSQFRRTFAALKKEHPSLGHAKAQEMAYVSCFGTSGAARLSSPNDLLALEYVRAAQGTPLTLHTVRRTGVGYNDTKRIDGQHPSATSLRLAMMQGEDMSDGIPPEVYPILDQAIACGKAPCQAEVLFPAIAHTLLLNSPNASENHTIHDATGGLYDRLRRTCAEATSLSSWIALSETKKFTRARIRRALWYSFFGVTSSDVRCAPGYTQILGANALGLSLLKRMRSMTEIPVLTKPSDDKRLPKEALRQKQLSDMADKLFALTSPVPSPMASALRFSPFLKK